MTTFRLYQISKIVIKEPKVDEKPEIDELDIRIFDKYDCSKKQKLSKKQGNLIFIISLQFETEPQQENIGFGLRFEPKI